MTASRRRSPDIEGWHGWNDYARFYDWENARTIGRRDVRFWQRLASEAGGRTLELGCGTGRILLPVARTGADVVGIDRSPRMLQLARQRLRRSCPRRTAGLVRGDIRRLPFGPARFDLVMAPYGVVQSLLSDADLTAALESVAAVSAPEATVAIDLVPDVPRWREYRNRVTLEGPLGPGRTLRLIESVRQDRARNTTVFEHRFVERARGRKPRTSRFEVVFRTLPTDDLARRLERSGFRVDAILGGYRGEPWTAEADTWVVLATRRKG